MAQPPLGDGGDGSEAPMPWEAAPGSERKRNYFKHLRQLLLRSPGSPAPSLPPARPPACSAPAGEGLLPSHGSRRRPLPQPNGPLLSPVVAQPSPPSQPNCRPTPTPILTVPSSAKWWPNGHRKATLLSPMATQCLFYRLNSPLLSAMATQWPPLLSPTAAPTCPS